MVRAYKKKETGGRANFGNSQGMTDAYNAVLSGNMSNKAAAKYFGVNKKSLLKRTSGELPVNASVGRNTVLSPICETELADCIKLMAEWGWGFSVEEIKDIVQEYVKSSHLETPFTESRPGRDWMEGFLRRHPDITPRTTEHLSRNRAAAEQPEILNHWFQLLDNVLEKAGVKNMPAQIFNSDESGFVTDPKSQKVLARKGSKRVNQTIGGSGREQVTVNCAGAASGKVLPPYVVYKGKNLYADWTKHGPDGAAYTTSENGWMEGPQFLDWFTKIFLRHTQDVSDKAHILIFDGHMSHLTVSVIEQARANNVVLLRLPAHLTHLLQPFDRAVFRPVKQKWQQLLIKYARTHVGPVGKKDFPAMLQTLYEESFQGDIIKAGFRSTGICPFSPQAVQLGDHPSTGPSAAPSPGPSTSTSSGPSTAPSPGPSAGPSTAPSPGPSTAPSPGPSTAPSPGPSTAPSPGPSTAPSPGPSTAPSPGPSTAPSPEPSSALSPQKSLKHFFLKFLQPAISNSRGRPRSARIQRFRYGESLTEEESLQRCQEAEAAKQRNASTGRGKGRGRGKGKGRGRQVSTRPRSRSPVDSSSASDSEDLTECRHCGQTGGENWIMCDICDSWFHEACANLSDTLENMENEEWICDFCSQ